MNNQYNVLPFYRSRDQQNFRKSYCYGDTCIFKLISRNDRLLPFQVIRAMAANIVTELNLYCQDDTLIGDILPTISSTDYTIETADEFDYITYFGNEDLSSALDCGTYYLELKDGSNTWYSELFTVETFTDNSTLSHRITDDIGTIRTTDDGTNERITDS